MNEIKGIARVQFFPGKLAEWKRLTEQALEIVRIRDTGTLQYEIFFNADESEAIVFERYRDADAALEHFANIGHLMGPLMQTAAVTGEVLGTPNAEMRANLTGPEPRLFTPWMVMEDEPVAQWHPPPASCLSTRPRPFLRLNRSESGDRARPEG